jgi:hypothetical protein
MDARNFNDSKVKALLVVMIPIACQCEVRISSVSPQLRWQSQTHLGHNLIPTCSFTGRHSFSQDSGDVTLDYALIRLVSIRLGNSANYMTRP